jgi:hypothetical protein
VFGVERGKPVLPRERVLLVGEAWIWGKG